MISENDWLEIKRLHDEAIDDFTHAALKIPPEQWNNAGNDKWGPAHLTEHLTLVYEVLLAELEGSGGMMVRTNWFERQMLRWFFVPGLLSGKPFPKGARAPRETRPSLLRSVDQANAVQVLKQIAERFSKTIQSSFEQNPKAQLTHAYFGKSTLDDSLLLCARHIQHHTKNLIAK